MRVAVWVFWAAEKGSAVRGRVVGPSRILSGSDGLATQFAAGAERGLSWLGLGQRGRAWRLYGGGVRSSEPSGARREGRRRRRGR